MLRRDVRWGIWIAVAITAYSAFASWVLAPLHAAAWCQPVLDYFNALAGALQFLGYCAVRATLARLGHTSDEVAWVLIYAVNAALAFTAVVALRVFWRRVIAPRPLSLAEAPIEAASAGQRLSRRWFLGTGLKVLGGGAVAVVGYSMFVEPRWPRVTRQEIRLRDLPPELDGLVAVQITDIHHGPWLSRERVRAIVETVNDLRPDLVFLTGDYIHRSRAYIAPVAAELGQLRPRIGIVAVLGNHDWLHDGGLMRTEFQRAGIPVIDNDRLILTPERRLVPSAERGLALCGVSDLREDWPDYQRALGGLPEGMARVLLSHNPDVAEEAGLTQSQLRVDLIVSGHTHGGQIRLPFLGTPIVHSRLGQKYREGLVQGPVCPVFICRGLGVVGVPIRLGVPPELAVLEFRT